MTPLRTLAASSAILGIVGVVDVWTGVDLSMSGLYFVPSVAVAWRHGASWGRVAAVVACGVGFFANVTLASSVLANAWNWGSRLIVHVGVVELVARLQVSVGQRERVIRELRDASSRVRELEELVRMCAWCRRIRTSDDGWITVEEYMESQTRTPVSHGICPQCYSRETHTAP